MSDPAIDTYHISLGLLTRPRKRIAFVFLSPIMKMKGRFAMNFGVFGGGPVGAIIIAVAAAASVPCSFTSMKAL